MKVPAGIKIVWVMAGFWLGLAATANAQDTRFTATASSTTVGVSEPFRLQFTIENATNLSGFNPPAFTGFDVLSQMQSSSTSIVNGQASRQISFIFVLQGRAPGRYTIAGAVARINGNSERSNPVTIEVTDTNNGNAGNNNNNNAAPAAPTPFSFPGSRPRDNDVAGVLKKGENVKDKLRKNVFIKVEVDKTNVYVGEQIIATYKLYTRLPTSSKVTRVPAFSGFSAHDIDLPNPPQATLERVNGVPFKVFTIRKTMLFPLQAGDLELDPVEVDNTVRLYQVNRQPHKRDPFDDIFNDPFFKDPFGNDPFDDPFFDNAFGGGNITYHDYDYNIKSKPVTIHVKPLPEKGKPENFNGAVGDFSIEASVDRRQLSTDDAGTLKVSISGSGNITLLAAPEVNFPPAFDTYDPKVSDQVNKNSSPFSGTRTFEYVFMPKDAGSFTIPQVSFSYFDPQSETYKTVQTQSFDLAVSQGSNRGGSRASDYALAGNGLQPIRTGQLAWSKAGVLWFTSGWYWLLLALPLIALIVLVAVRKRKDKLQSDQVLLKNRRANKVARKRLSLAAQYLKKHDSKAFYEEVSKAAWGYLCDKLNIPFADLTRQRAEEKLREKNIPAPAVQKLFGLLDNCEMALYAGMGGHEKMKETYNQAAEVIGSLEEQLK